MDPQALRTPSREAMLVASGTLAILNLALVGTDLLFETWEPLWRDILMFLTNLILLLTWLAL